MQTLLSKAVTIARQDGIRVLVDKISQYIHNHIKNTIREIRYRVCQLSGYKTLKIDPVEAVFYVNDRADCRAISYFKRYEMDMIRDMVDEISDHEIIWDIGANFGLYTCILQKNPHVEVIAFEPLPENQRRLQNNLDLNKLHCDIKGFALSNIDEKVDFGFDTESDRSYGGAKIITGHGDDVISVEARKGDSLNLPQPTIVKIDVEGAESDVIEGMEETLTHPKCRLLYCEIHHADEGSGSTVKEYGSSPEEVEQHLKEFGFSIEVIVDREKQMQIKASK